MKTTTGTIESVDQRNGQNGAYLYLEIEGTQFGCFQSDLFSQFKGHQGEQITVSYEESHNEDTGQTYRNIKEIGGGSNNNGNAGTGYSPNSSSSNNGGSGNTGGQKSGMTDKEVRDSAVGHAVNLITKTDRNAKVSKLAGKIADFIEHGN